MEILKDKRVLIGGLVLLGAVGYYFMTKNKKVVESDSMTSNTTDTTVANTTDTTTPKEDNYAVTLGGAVDPTGAIYLVLEGKKYGFISGDAWRAYGTPSPKTITKAELDAIPNGGYVFTDGKVIKQS